MFILADTGILLRLLERADPQHADIRQALRMIHQRGDRCVTSGEAELNVGISKQG